MLFYQLESFSGRPGWKVDSILWIVVSGLYTMVEVDSTAAAGQAGLSLARGAATPSNVTRAKKDNDGQLAKQLQ